MKEEKIQFFLKHLTISTIRKVSEPIQVYGLSNMSRVCLHWHQCWYRNITLDEGHPRNIWEKFG